MASLDNTLGSMYRNMIGLFNVDNTSDINKPISTATQTSLDTKAPILNPIFTGSVTLPNVDINTTNNNLAATTSYVNSRLSSIPLKLHVDLVSTTNQILSSSTIYNYDISSAAFKISSTDFAFGTGDFTCEAWINMTSYYYVSIGTVIFDTRTNASTNGILFMIKSSGNMGYYHSNTGEIYSNAKVELNTLTHIVYQRVGNFIQFYVNGIYVDQLAFSQDLSTSTQLIISRGSDRDFSDNNYKFKGIMNNIRITKAAVYSGNFTPSVTLSALTNTILLISNNPVTDISGTNKTITIEGSIIYNTIINTALWMTGIDSVVPTINNRILFVGQTNQKENGIYVMTNSTTLNRSSDFPLNYTANGTNVFIKSGFQYANTNWVCTNLTGSDIVGSNNLVFNSIKTDIIPISKITNLQTSLDSKLNLTGGTLTGGLTGTTATFSGPLIANGGLTGTTASFSADLTVFGRILCNLPNYVDNTTAKNAGVPIGALYRTGGIIKIRLDDIPPTVTLIGSSNLVVTTLTYTDPGVTATDNYDTTISVYLTSFLFNSTNIISTPVLITGTNTVVTTTTPLQFGNIYNLTYTAIDTTGNFSTISRNISVETPTVTTTYLYTTTNIRVTSDRRLPTFSNNNLVETSYSAWAPLTSSLNNIDFNIDNQWTFIFKVVQSDSQRYRIYFDPLFRYSGSAWGTNTSLGIYAENDDSLAGGFYAHIYDDTSSMASGNPTYTVTNILSGLNSSYISSASGYMIYIKYDSSKYLTIEMWSGNGATRYYTAKRNQPYTFVNKLAPFAFYTNLQTNGTITYQKGILYSNTNVAITAWNTYFP